MIKQDLVFGSIIAVLTVVPIEQEKDLMFYIGIVWVVALGVMLKTMMEVKKGTFTWRGLVIQSCITLPISYFAYRVWLTYKLDFDLQNYMFVIAFSAQAIAAMIDKVTSIGWNAAGESLLAYIQNSLKKKEGAE